MTNIDYYETEYQNYILKLRNVCYLAIVFCFLTTEQLPSIVFYPEQLPRSRRLLLGNKHSLTLKCSFDILFHSNQCLL